MGDDVKRNGFTLIEVLAAIVILSLLIAIITPTIANLINNSKSSLEREQINTIIRATKQYVVEHSEILPDGGSINISIDELVENGVIENDMVINPKTKTLLNGYVVISYNDNFNQYEYQFVKSNE